jgi:hypothetical protein
MKKLYTLSIALLSAVSFGQSIIITKVVDGTLPIEGCSGSGASNPKFVELYISGTLDLYGYRVQTESNGAANEGAIAWNDGLFLTALGEVTDSFVYLVNLPQAQEGQTQLEEIGVFLEMYPEIPTDKIIFSTYAPNMNGNDAIRVAQYDGDNLVTVIDQFGNPLDVSGSQDINAAWAYQDSYASRNNGSTANAGNFNSASFTYGGNNALDNLPCADFETAVAIGTYSILSSDKFDAISGLSVYPNPLSGNTLTIASDNNAEKTVAVYDVLGKQVLNTKTVNGTINAQGLTAGVYILKITEEGKTATKKLVVK